MDAKTREALEKSIKHWEENVAAQSLAEIRTGAFSCALCLLFLSNGCKGCPVDNSSGNSCDGTPWEPADIYHHNCTAWPENWNAKTWQPLAQAEVDFLKSLRPSDEQESA